MNCRKPPIEWSTVNLGSLINLSTGKLDANAADINGQYPFFTCAESISQINTWAFDTSAVILAGNGSFSIKRYTGKFNAYQRTYIIEPVLIKIDFLYWVIRGNIISITMNGRGSTIPYIRKGDITDIQISLPPLAEQKIIADKLDDLFARVESIKTRLENIPEILKKFRQSVLNAAVSGKLTDDWRKNNSYEEWKKLQLIDVIESKPRNGYSPKGVDYKTPVKNLTLSAITQGYFSKDCFKYVDIEVPETSHLWIKKDDILIQRANSIDYVGISAIYRGDDDKYIYPDLIMKVRANDRIITEYLHYCLLSEDTREYFRQNASGTTGNMPKINQGTVSAVSIKLPPLPEQIEIVRRAEKIFNFSESIERLTGHALSQINKLTQSILAKAFRGELTAQWREENPELISGINSAEALLEKITAEKLAVGTVKKRAKKTSH
ncbi:restriction endonuclease subunit S [Cronobacter dublinensis]